MSWTQYRRAKPPGKDCQVMQPRKVRSQPRRGRGWPDATSRRFGTDPSTAYARIRCKVVPIEVHHLGPRADEVLDELRLRVRAAVDLGQGPELGVRAEHEIDARARPLERARLPIAPFEHVLGVRCRLPLRAHVE